MDRTERGQVAVIFISRRNGNDPAGYAAAAAAMEAEAARQPGYVGFESARGNDGLGITVSLWEDEAAAQAWRDHAGHSIIRDRGRALWYDSYEVIVAAVTRAYAWPQPEKKADPEGPAVKV
jgi:heme-degrading monooxygenase HmoA